MFLGVELRCGSGALIPRPETELLGRTAIEKVTAAGPSATLSLNTGTLFALANEGTPFSKDPTKAYSVDLMVTISGTVS